MILSKYINWPDLWDEEVCLDVELDETENDEYIQIIKQFLNDDEVSLESDECVCCINEYDYDVVTYTFNFCDSGGQNESDTQGWFRCYWFIFKSESDGDLELIDCEYEQD